MYNGDTLISLNVYNTCTCMLYIDLITTKKKIYLRVDSEHDSNFKL